jgi:tripartite-type tricarboxylate transporter receptor subunit TctC
VASDTRLVLATDIPTFAEMGLPTVSFPVWYGLFAPSGTPKEIIVKLNRTAVEAIADPAVHQVLPRENPTDPRRWGRNQEI